MPCLPRRLRRLDLDSVPTAPRFLGPTNGKFWIRLCSSGGGGPEWFSCRGARNLKLRHWVVLWCYCNCKCNWFAASAATVTETSDLALLWLLPYIMTRASMLWLWCSLFSVVDSIPYSSGWVEVVKVCHNDTAPMVYLSKKLQTTACCKGVAIMPKVGSETSASFWWQQWHQRRIPGRRESGWIPHLCGTFASPTRHCQTGLSWRRQQQQWHQQDSSMICIQHKTCTQIVLGVNR